MSDTEINQISIIVKNIEDEINSEYSTDLDLDSDTETGDLSIIDKNDIEQNVNVIQHSYYQHNYYIITRLRFCFLYYFFIVLSLLIYFCYYN